MESKRNDMLLYFLALLCNGIENIILRTYQNGETVDNRNETKNYCNCTNINSVMTAYHLKHLLIYGF